MADKDALELKRILALIPDAPDVDVWPNASEAPLIMMPSELRILKRAILRAEEAKKAGCDHIWHAGDQGCRKCGAPKGDSK